jgi:crotonobetainyl-CoA:carnitine CoA-transferase CaiB-like acyl-CoA transferase
VRPSPEVGQDTDEVLRSAGFTEEELAGLHRDGVVV